MSRGRSPTRRGRLTRLALFVGMAVPVACFVACATGSASGRPTDPSTGSNWALTFVMSGGIAGFDRQLELSSTGAATATDRRRQLTRTAQVPDDELMSIGSLVATTGSLDVRSRGCRDCFEYELDLQADGTHVIVRANDMGLTGTAAAPLVSALSRLLNRVLSGEPR